MKQETGDEYISIGETARLLGVHTMTVRRRIQAGLLGDVVRLSNKLVRLKRAAVLQYIKQNTQGGEK